jgi:hypothetical protein
MTWAPIEAARVSVTHELITQEPAAYPVTHEDLKCIVSIRMMDMLLS